MYVYVYACVDICVCVVTWEDERHEYIQYIHTSHLDVLPVPTGSLALVDVDADALHTHILLQLPLPSYTQRTQGYELEYGIGYGIWGELYGLG